MMTKKTALALARLHAVHQGKEYRLPVYDCIRKAEDYPTVETLRRYEAVEAGSVEWYYSEGDDNAVNAYNCYVTIIIR